MSVEIIRNVPADEVDLVRNSRLDLGGTVIQILREDDGEFTLVVIYPETEGQRIGSLRVFSPTT